MYRESVWTLKLLIKIDDCTVRPTHSALFYQAKRIKSWIALKALEETPCASPTTTLFSKAEFWILFFHLTKIANFLLFYPVFELVNILLSLTGLRNVSIASLSYVLQSEELTAVPCS